MHRNPTARLFVAVDLPEGMREQLVEWTRADVRSTNGRTGEGAPLRVLDPELLHLTLCFLGSRPTAEIDAIAAALAACGGSAGELSLGAPLWLPVHRPRALAVEVHDDSRGLASLRASILVALKELCGADAPHAEDPTGAGVLAPARRHRRFRPHITVARMRGGATDRRSTGSSIGRRERVLPATPSLSFVPSELVLYRSWLSPEGASYEAVATHPIG